MMFFKSLWLMLPLLLIGCGGGGSDKGFPIDHCTTDCVAGNERLVIEPGQATLIPGASRQLYAVLIDENEAHKEVVSNVVWQSANPAIATVSAQGLVTAVAVGATEISARYGDKLQATASIQVVGAAITGLQLVPASQLSTPGLTHQYRALGLLGAGLKVDVTEAVNWSVSNPTVAAVTAQGRVSSLAVGSTQVFARLQSFTTSGHLKVVAPTQVELKITPASVSTPVGTEVLFEASLRLGNQELDVSEHVQWQSSSLTIADFQSPSTPGLASAKTAGGVVITASLSYQGRSLAAAAQLNVTAAQITSLRITPDSLSLPVGVRGALKAIAEFSDGTSKDVTHATNWSSGNIAIAEVATLTKWAGWVSAIGSGTTLITAQYAGFSETAGVTVTNASLLLLNLRPQSAIVTPDIQLSYSLIAHFSDGSSRDVTSAALFSSSAPDVAVIESGGIDGSGNAGLATAISAGSADIRASYLGQQASAPLTVLAQDVRPQNLSLAPAQSELLVGSKLQYRALLTLSNGHQQDVTGSVRWTSSDANVASVDEKGLAVAVSSGSAGIGVYLPLLRTEGLTAMANLDVVQSAVVALHLQPASKLSVPGLEHQYTALAELDSGELADVSDQVSWSVSNGSVVAIDENGLALTKAVGRSNIIATLGSHQASGVIQVVDSNTVSLAISPVSASEPVGSELQYSALLTVGTQKVDVTDQVIWRSGAPQVANFIQTTEPGLISASRPGTGVVGASFIYKGVVVPATADINVNTATVTGVRVAPTSLSLPAGTSGSVRALASFSDGSERDVTAAANWQSANPAIVMVQQRSQQADNIQALAVGSVTVTASFSGFSASANVRVTSAILQSLLLSPQEVVISSGVQVEYQVLANYSDGAKVDVTSVAVFNSSNRAVAIIQTGSESAGLATGLTAGTSQIQASYGGLQATGNLTVAAADVTPKTLIISPATAELLIGSQLQYRAVVTMSNGRQQDVTRSVVWSSGDTGITSIDNNGLALGAWRGGGYGHHRCPAIQFGWRRFDCQCEPEG